MVSGKGIGKQQCMLAAGVILTDQQRVWCIGGAYEHISGMYKHIGSGYECISSMYEHIGSMHVSAMSVTYRQQCIGSELVAVMDISAAGIGIRSIIA